MFAHRKPSLSERVQTIAERYDVPDRGSGKIEVTLTGRCRPLSSNELEAPLIARQKPCGFGQSLDRG